MKKLILSLCLMTAIQTIAHAQIRVTKEQHRTDSLYRDSLIKVAQGYKIGFTIADEYNPDVIWLRSTIRQKEYELKRGNNYNDYNITALINFIQDKIPPATTFTTGELIFKIDIDGSIVNITSFGNSNLLAETLDAINRLVDGKKIDPFILNGKPYLSYKRVSIKYIPVGASKYRLGEVGPIYGGYYFSN